MSNICKLWNVPVKMLLTAELHLMFFSFFMLIKQKVNIHEHLQKYFIIKLVAEVVFNFFSL